MVGVGSVFEMFFYNFCDFGDVVFVLILSYVGFWVDFEICDEV